MVELNTRDIADTNIPVDVLPTVDHQRRTGDPQLTNGKLISYPLIGYPRPSAWRSTTQWWWVIDCIDTCASFKEGILDLGYLREGAQIERSQTGAPSEEGLLDLG